MSADNGYVIQMNDQGKYVVQMYFASNDDWPNPNVDQNSIPMFDTLEEAVNFYLEGGEPWSEYGLSFNLPEKEKDHKVTIKTAQYTRKPFTIEAVQVTSESLSDLAVWCNGSVMLDDKGHNYIKVKVTSPQTPKQTMAYPGDWLLASRNGYKVYTDRAFKKNFIPAKEMVEALEPHEIRVDIPTDFSLIEAQSLADIDGLLPRDYGIHR